MKKRPREPKPLHPTLVSATGPALIKHLASCDTTVRSQSLRLIQSWLASQTQHLSDSDIKKLWKGLFYCLWHADKTPNQLSLINRLINLFLSLQPSVSLEFFRGFVVTLRREWPGIDKLRLDKFYLLIRRFIRALFELMRLRKWDLDVLGEYFGVLEKDGFLAEDKLQQGNGVNYHIASVFLDELKGVGFPVRKEVVDVILRPFFEVIMRGKDKILLGKLKSCVFYELVKLGKETLVKKRMGTDWDKKDGDVLFGAVSLRMGLSGRFYEVGSSVECVLGNRKLALELHEEFLKLEKELESSGIEIAIPEYSDLGGGDGDDEVPQPIPIDYNASNCNVEFESQAGADGAHEDGDWSDGRSFKKSKKVGKGIDGDDKKDKQQKKKKKKMKRRDDNGVSEINLVPKENGDSVTTNSMEIEHSFTANGNILNDGQGSDGSPVALSETMISNLQKQFEKVAAEAGSYSDEDSDSCHTPLISVQNGMLRKKRKKTESADFLESENLDSNGTDAATTSAQKSVKKVRFCLKNNLVWKPHTPLPPESLRLPPSVTPRGSALKKGVPPGPIIETPPVKKKVKQKKRVPKKLKGAAHSKLRNKRMHT